MPRRAHSTLKLKAKDGKDYRLYRRGDRGSYSVAYTQDGQTRLISTGTDNEASAEAYLRDFVEQINEAARPQGPLLSDLCDLYIEDCEARKIRTLVTAKRNLEAVKRKLGHIAAEELRPSHIRQYTQARAKDPIGHKGQGSTETVGINTIRRELALLAATLNLARSEGLITNQIKIARPSPAPPVERWLTHEEAAKLIDAAKEPHLKLFIRIALATGARSGAIKELTWDRVDFERRQIDFGHGESNKARAVVPYPRSLDSHLRLAYAIATTEYVIEYRGKPLVKGGISKGFRHAVQRANIPHCTPHDLRRTAGSWMLQAGVPIELVSRMLGHTTTHITQKVYARHTVEWLRTASEALEIRGDDAVIEHVKIVGED